MKKALNITGWLFLTAALLAGTALQAKRVEQDIVAIVGSEKIDTVEFEAKVTLQERGLKRKLNQNERQGVLQALVNQRLLVEAARDLDLQKKDEVRRSVQDYERQLLAGLVYDSEISAKAKVSEEETRRFFDANPALFELRQVSQILVQVSGTASSDAAEKKALGIKRRLAANLKSFAKVAKLESDDLKSRQRGGDLGSLRRGMLIPELEKAVFAAKPDSIIGPVKTEFGFHILLLKSVRQESYDEAKETLNRELSQKSALARQQKLLEELSKKYKITFSKDKP